MDWHVHVYELKAKGEIELPAESEKEALAQALAATKEGKVICDQEPETEHMALAFPGKRNQKESATVAKTKRPDNRIKKAKELADGLTRHCLHGEPPLEITMALVEGIHAYGEACNYIKTALEAGGIGAATMLRTFRSMLGETG